MNHTAKDAMDTIEWFVVVDWGSEVHHVCIIGTQGRVHGERSFAHSGFGLADLAAWFLRQAGTATGAIAVALEVPHGPVVETLMERGFIVHSLNPKQLDRFRDRFSLAGAKDDRRDAWVLADALRTDGRFFRRLDPVEPEVAELREWTRIADELIAERTRLVADPPIRRGRFRGAGDLQQPKPTYTRDFGLIFVPPARNSAANGATNAGPSTEP